MAAILFFSVYPLMYAVCILFLAYHVIICIVFFCQFIIINDLLRVGEYYISYPELNAEGRHYQFIFYLFLIYIEINYVVSHERTNGVYWGWGVFQREGVCCYM